MYCCHALDNLIQNAGNRGISVLVGQINDSLFFSLQMRSIAFSDREKVSQLPTTTALEHIILTESIRIRYCPSCGKSLADIVSAHSEELEKLVLEHDPLQDDWGI